MVWGAILQRGTTALCIVEGTVDVLSIVTFQIAFFKRLTFAIPKDSKTTQDSILLRIQDLGYKNSKFKEFHD